MRALVFDGKEARVRDVAPPDRRDGEARVRVVRAGICNTDLEIVRGYMGFTGVLGHELSGVVEEHPDPSWIGRRVAGEINLACGSCPTCARGLGRHCPARTVLGILGKDGCFAEQVTLPIGNLQPLPDAVDDDRAVFVEPLAACFEILEQVRVERGMDVAVLGDGKLGLLAAMVLARAGARVVIAGRHERKLGIAARAGLHIATAQPSDLDPASYDLVVEATGSPAGLERAIALARPRGTVVMKSTFHGAAALPTAPVVIHELTLIGSRCGPFAPAIAALAAGEIDPTPLVDAVVPFGDAEDALRRAAEPGVLKVVLLLDR